jgi:hypothetical protein
MTVDWQRVILNLKSGGVSYRTIAKRCRCDESTVGHLVRGEQREPKFSTGLALLDLHLSMCPDKHQEIRL